MSRPLSLVILITGVALYTAFIIWTVRRLWRPVVDSYSRVVYWFGVRLGGVIFWLVLSVGGSLSSESALSPFVSTLIALYTGFPICLWGGYAFGRTMACVYGLSESS
jgi:hypothetical protein